MIQEYIKKNRTYRKFDHSVKVTREEVEAMLNVVRLSSSANNLQVLRYGIYTEEEDCKTIEAHIAWAARLKDWKGPKEEERPSAYVIFYKKKGLQGLYQYDCGIAATNLLLLATEKGLGGVMFASFNNMEDALGVEDYDVALVVAIGKPREEVVLEDAKNGEIAYYRDEHDVHHVPKRLLSEILIN